MPFIITSLWFLSGLYIWVCPQGCFWHCIWHDKYRLSWQAFIGNTSNQIDEASEARKRNISCFVRRNRESTTFIENRLGAGLKIVDFGTVLVLEGTAIVKRQLFKAWSPLRRPPWCWSQRSEGLLALPRSDLHYRQTFDQFHVYLTTCKSIKWRKWVWQRYFGLLPWYCAVFLSLPLRRITD